MCNDWAMYFEESITFIGDCCRALWQLLLDCCEFSWKVFVDCCTACWKSAISCIIKTCVCCGHCCVGTWHCIRDSPIVKGCGRCCIGCKNCCVDCCQQSQECCVSCCETFCSACDACCRQCCSGCLGCCKQCCEGCSTKCIGALAACCACCLYCLRCGYVPPCCEKCCNYNTYYCNKCELCIRRCCFTIRTCFTECTLAQTCCICVQDINLAVLLISLIAFLTNPIISWISVRHAYVIKFAPIVSWITSNVDAYDIGLSNFVVFGVGSSAGLPGSCLSKNTVTGETNLTALGVLNDAIYYMGFLIVTVDLVFLICSLALFICVLKRSFYGAAIAFTVFGLLSLLLTLAYSSIYVKSCMMLGKSFPLGQFLYLLVDFFVWVYFLNIVISYLRWHNRNDFEDPYRHYPSRRVQVKELQQNHPVESLINKQPTSSKQPDRLEILNEKT